MKEMMNLFLYYPIQQFLVKIKISFKQYSPHKDGYSLPGDDENKEKQTNDKSVWDQEVMKVD